MRDGRPQIDLDLNDTERRTGVFSGACLATNSDRIADSYRAVGFPATGTGSSCSVGVGRPLLLALVLQLRGDYGHSPMAAKDVSQRSWARPAC